MLPILPAEQSFNSLLEDGHLRREQVAPSTFRRFVRQLELLEPDTDERRQAFCKAHINQLWQADTMVGPHVPVAGPGSPKRPAPPSTPWPTTVRRPGIMGLRARV